MLAMTGVDLQAAARTRARYDRNAQFYELIKADAQDLPGPDASFETAVATFVFCSVPDPVLGLSELRRVVVQGGQLLLLEHVLSQHPLLRVLMRLFNPLTVRMTGANVDRKTVENLLHAGFVGVSADDLWLDIVKLIEARAPRGKDPEECRSDERRFTATPASTA